MGSDGMRTRKEWGSKGLQEGRRKGWNMEEGETDHLRKGHRQSKRKEEVPVFINFTLLLEFHPLHLNFGARTLPIFTVL